MRADTAALALGASLRLTRLIVTDDLGQWWVKDPLRNYVLQRIPTEQAEDYLDGLDCPFCVGFWIGAGVLASAALLGERRSWRFVAGALTLNYVAAHLGARLGDTASEDSDD